MAWSIATGIDRSGEGAGPAITAAPTSQRPRPVAPRQVQDADVVARIEIERRQLGVGAEGHRQEEADAVLDAALGEADDAVEQAPRLLLGGHL